MPSEKIIFEHTGIGHVLATRRLSVPLNQREYSWEDEHVEDLYSDLANARDEGHNYFLGTIVLTGHDKAVPEVADGQQRLSTLMIMLAAVRDWLLKNGDEKRAKAVEDKFLFEVDIKTTERIPKLSLNVDDNEFFIKRILSRRGEADKKIPATRYSHERLEKAYAIARGKLEAILSAYSDDHKTERLVAWIEYLENGGEVIVLSVPDHLDAFVMFETLNDRGLKVSQADLLKNHLLKIADTRIQEAQQSWAKMVGTLESVGDDLSVVTYLHHYLITKEGETKEREVFDRVRNSVKNQRTLWLSCRA